MSTRVTITLPDPVYQEAQKVAQSTQRNVQEVLTEVITKNFKPFPVNKNRSAMLQEIEAYKSLHPQLVKQYEGQYVAIFHGQMVDHDNDPVELHHRVNSRFPGETVLHRKVGDDPDPILRFRSPRLIPNP
jgi:hypothetical protein